MGPLADQVASTALSAHTHQPYVCTIAGKLVTSAASFGRVITDVDLTIDHRTKAVKAATATNRIVASYLTVPPAPLAPAEPGTRLARHSSRVVSPTQSSDVDPQSSPTGGRPPEPTR